MEAENSTEDSACIGSSCSCAKTVFRCITMRSGLFWTKMWTFFSVLALLLSARSLHPCRFAHMEVDTLSNASIGNDGYCELSCSIYSDVGLFNGFWIAFSTFLFVPISLVRESSKVSPAYDFGSVVGGCAHFSILLGTMFATMNDLNVFCKHWTSFRPAFVFIFIGFAMLSFSLLIQLNSFHHSQKTDSYRRIHV